jgi:hyperosmotically inducible periplasmic protein
MSTQWLRILLMSALAAPMSVKAAPAGHHGHDHAGLTKPAAKKATAAKAAPKKAKPKAGAAKAMPGPGMGPGAMLHRPPTPPSSSASRRAFDVPQAKTLAETPDVVLNSRVRAALIASLSTASQEIIPETKKGVVTLTGTVTSAQQRTTAEQVARKTRGVRGVKNQLRVKPGARVSQR